MGRLAQVAAVAALAGVIAASASATEWTIVPGVGIGKLKLGMTLAQAERALGKDHLVNDSGTVGDRRFVDYGWNFSSWSASFVQHGKTRQLVQVATTLRAQRTATGLGVGAPFKSVVRAFPDATCLGYYTTLGSEAITTGVGPDKRNYSPALVVKRNGVKLAFFVKPATGNPSASNHSSPWDVYQVLMRAPVPGEVDTYPHSECAFGWRERGSPYP